MNKIKVLAQYIKESNNIVFFGGAGVSTESGLKDFRSPDGLYNEKWVTKYPSSTERKYLVQKKGATKSRLENYF